jgi:hypothetical protein
VLSSSLNRTKLKKYICQSLKQIISNISLSLDDTSDKIIIIGACYPINNILLSLNDNIILPKKLHNFLNTKQHIKYILKESDILIDIDIFNSIVMEIFNECFSNDNICNKLFGEYSKNIIFITHNKLDCYMVFKAIKWIYGQSNCVNVWKNTLNSPCNNIVALNDLISKYVNNKRMLNSNMQFKIYVNEIKQYLQEKIGI